MRSELSALVLIAVTAAVALSGCGGPTKAGIEAREEAQRRLGLVNAQVSYDQAEKAYETGQFERALREINGAISRVPDVAKYHVLKGRIYIETHRLQNAVEAFEEALEHDEESDEAHYYLGIVYQRWSRHEDAYAHYMKASEIDQSNVQYLLAAAESRIAMDDPDGARELIEPRLDYFEHSAALRHLLSQIAMLEGDAERAAQMLSDARTLRPDDISLLEELAWVQYDAGMYGRCHESIRNLMTKIEEPRNDLLLLKARCLTNLERYIEARRIYLDLTERDPSDVDVWVELGALAWELGDHRRVVMSSRRVMSLAPERYEGYLLSAMYKLQEGEVEEAAELASKAAERTDTSALPHVFAGRALERNGDTEGAIRAYARALQIEPNNQQANRSFSRLNGEDHVTGVPVD